MATRYLEASQQHDPRSPNDSRLQPWRQWWPASSAPAVYDSQEPWLKWAFDPDKRFDKPWAKWKMKWPSSYNNLIESPQPVYDPEFIRAFERKFSSGENPPPNWHRTNSYLQFFFQDSKHVVEKPYVSKIPPPEEGMLQINFGGKYEKVVITDIRGHEAEFTLDKDGFEFLQNVTSHEIFNLAEDIGGYISDISQWLKGFLRCGEVFVFDYAFRTEQKESMDGYVDVARRVHCDQSPRSAIGRIKLHLGPRAEALLKHRCRLINVWRPLIPVVESYPLAMCSFQTVKRSDFIPVDIVYPHYAEEAFEIRPSPAHNWYFRSSVTDNDIILLKIYDNKPGVAFCAPHSGFKDPLAPEGASIRSSIELRCLVFGDDFDIFPRL